MNTPCWTHFSRQFSSRRPFSQFFLREVLPRYTINLNTPFRRRLDLPLLVPLDFALSLKRVLYLLCAPERTVLNDGVVSVLEETFQETID